jgi:prepilin-type processing-associated H-X9-DG protein
MNLGHIFWAEAMARYLDRGFQPLPYNAGNRDQQLASRLARIAVYQCPVFPNDQMAVDYIINGWNKYLPNGETSPALKVTKLKRSAEIVLLTEVSARHRTDTFEYHDIWSLSHLPRYPGTCRMLDDARHRGNVNVCYLDGHVVARPFKGVTETDFRSDFQ